MNKKIQIFAWAVFGLVCACAPRSDSGHGAFDPKVYDLLIYNQSTSTRGTSYQFLTNVAEGRRDTPVKTILDAANNPTKQMVFAKMDLYLNADHTYQFVYREYLSCKRNTVAGGPIITFKTISGTWNINSEDYLVLSKFNPATPTNPVATDNATSFFYDIKDPALLIVFPVDMGTAGLASHPVLFSRNVSSNSQQVNAADSTVVPMAQAASTIQAQQAECKP